MLGENLDLRVCDERQMSNPKLKTVTLSKPQIMTSRMEATFGSVTNQISFLVTLDVANDELSTDFPLLSPQTLKR